MIKARVFVNLKKPVLDPQGVAILRSLKTLGFAQVEGVRQGKTFDVELATDDLNQAKEMLAKMSEKLLANTVIEDYSFTLL